MYLIMWLRNEIYMACIPCNIFVIVSLLDVDQPSTAQETKFFFNPIKICILLAMLMWLDLVSLPLLSLIISLQFYASTKYIYNWQWYIKYKIHKVDVFPYLKPDACVFLNYHWYNSTVKINRLVSNYDITIKSHG